MLREILERDLCANARAQGERLRAGFERLATKYGVIGDIRGKGLFQGIEFVKDVKTKERFPANRASACRSANRRWRTACCAASTRTGWRSARR